MMHDMRDMKVTTGELSEILGVSLRTVQRLAQSGVLDADGIKNRNKIYDLPKTVQAYIGYLREQHAAEMDKSGTEKLKEEKLRAEVELKRSQGELHQIKTALTKGEYLPVEDVRLDYERFFVILKKFVTAIPSRVGGIVAGYVEPVVARGVEKDLQQEVNQMLRTFVAAGQTAPQDDAP